jgi:hypothetical protein
LSSTNTSNLTKSNKQSLIEEILETDFSKKDKKLNNCEKRKKLLSDEYCNKQQNNGNKKEENSPLLLKTTNLLEKNNFDIFRSFNNNFNTCNKQKSKTATLHLLSNYGNCSNNSDCCEVKKEIFNQKVFCLFFGFFNILILLFSNIKLIL